MLCGPGPRLKTPWLTVGSFTHTAGSLPQLAEAVGTADVVPIETAESSISKLSPLRNASVTVSVTPSLGATKVHGGGPAKCEFPALLGPQPGALLSAGAHPFAKLPAAPKLNSFHGPLMLTGPAGAILAVPGVWGRSVVPFCCGAAAGAAGCCAKAGTDKKPTKANAIGAVILIISSLHLSGCRHAEPLGPTHCGTMSKSPF